MKCRFLLNRVKIVHFTAKKIAKNFIFTLLCLTSIYCQPSFALNKLGHQVVCQLAYNNLSALEQQRVDQLLQAVPKKERQLINRYNRDKKDSPLNFAKSCTWADAIKKQTKYKSFSAWHYVNLPRDLVRINKASCYDNCLPQAILHHQAILKNTPRSWQSAQALLFLGHWLGDIHQPLHVSFASDLGGNKIRLTKSKNHGRCTNLHWYWDDCLIQQARRSPSQWTGYLQTSWHKINVNQFQAAQVWQWANESLQIVRLTSFQYCQKDSPQSANCQQPQGKVTLANNYPELYLPVMEQQLVKAAKRLTLLLSASL